ncbi:membrane protein insertion efficiency factor YidD [Halomonas salicampi]|uniref:Putative membrane protein insertion efficiency factor n=2 Tax=Vreelandella salicampi TaxID=1449798 RepID=A0A7Z0LKR7_9GAMM|nr:membrane protein insertion efficiency factor YidD [Halomonas salicampi]
MANAANRFFVRFKKRLRRFFIVLLTGMVRGYQLVISPLLGPRCRFWPSCSSYTIEAIQVHGPLKGTWMAVKRMAKCHPGSDGGLDPVPGGPSEKLCQEDEELCCSPNKRPTLK